LTSFFARMGSLWLATYKRKSRKLKLLVHVPQCHWFLRQQFQRNKLCFPRLFFYFRFHSKPENYHLHPEQNIWALVKCKWVFIVFLFFFYFLLFWFLLATKLALQKYEGFKLRILPAVLRNNRNVLECMLTIWKEMRVSYFACQLTFFLPWLTIILYKKLWVLALQTLWCYTERTCGKVSNSNKNVC